jgi:hypothetical protein
LRKILSFVVFLLILKSIDALVQASVDNHLRPQWRGARRIDELQG